VPIRVRRGRCFRPSPLPPPWWFFQRGSSWCVAPWKSSGWSR